MSKRNKTDTGMPKVRFSIGAKLVTIISILVLVSLGTITGLVSYLVRQDLQITAEENNFEVNRRSATQTEQILNNIRSNSLVLMQIINAAGADSAIAKLSADFFYDRNQHIAALVFPIPGRKDHLLINYKFFLSREIDELKVNFFFEKNSDVLLRAAAGETIFLNAAFYFDIPMLAVFFPTLEGDAQAILFSPDHLDDIFSYGTNQSCLINGDGDILVHADFEQVRAGANISNLGYVQSIRENPARNRQDLFTEDGILYFVAYTKLNDGASIVITIIEYNKVFEGIAATTRRNLYLTGTVLSISIVLIWFFSKSISIPLKALAAAAHTIEGGGFEVNLKKAKGRDEIGVLTSSFQRMSSALNIFGRFTNRDIAVRAMRGEIKPGGEPKHATIFFSDIRGFTEKSENFTDEFEEDASDRIVHWLNTYLTQMVDCVERTGGAVDKFIGDAVMAHWGTAYTAGTPQRDAFNAIKASLMMRMALVMMNKKRKPEDPGDPMITIGCGLNTGIVTAGQIGSDLRMEYTVIGDPVNLASRVESLNKPLGTDILITENTWNLVKDFIIVEEMPAVTVKGKEEPVRLFAVVNLASITSGPRTLAEVRKLLGINPPDISNVDLNAEEKKYKIGGEK